MAELTPPMLVVADGTELPEARAVWGTGGWRPAPEREALDWLTLAALAGWDVALARRGVAGEAADLAAGTRFVVVACDPDSLGEATAARLASRLAVEPLLVVGRAASPRSAFARLAGASRGPERVTGRLLQWHGPGPSRTWLCRAALEGHALDLSPEAAAWATLDGAPIIAGRSVGRGSVATLGFHPSEARDRDGAGTALLRHLLVQGAPAPVAWLDLENVLVLRMDDPGGAQNIYLRSWAHAKLGEPEWAAIANELRARNARLSIGYTAGWVDDGDASRGELYVGGRAVPRVPGRVHPSPGVRYVDRAGHLPGAQHDGEAEFRGIHALRAAGLGDVELHGYTHMHPDAVSWARAPDRYDAAAWFRELGARAEPILAARPAAAHPLALGAAALREHFGVHPTTLICPGDEWTEAALEVSLGLGVGQVSSYYLALRRGDRFCWTQHVAAPYLDEPDAGWFDSGLPVVGYFHDRDIAVRSVGWLGRALDAWRAAGARRLLDMRELAGAVGGRVQLEERDGELRLAVDGAGRPPRVRPVPLLIRVPGGRLPPVVSAVLGDEVRSLSVEAVGAGVGRVVLPADVRGTTPPMPRSAA